MKRIEYGNALYDVVIIGSGIGGLICAAYLSKSGLKVLVVEQHDKPGGCCTSFDMNGYRFDVGVHFLGSLRNGVLNKILSELEILDDLKVVQFDPVEKIIVPDCSLYVRADPFDTIDEFKKHFPEEKEQLDRFFKFILNDNFFINIYPKIRKLTFDEFLSEFFNNEKLKAIFNVISLWNIGAEAKTGLALSCVALLREYVLDAGHYPTGGIQSFPDLLSSLIVKGGGEVILKTKVKEIIISNSCVKGVLLENGDIIKSNLVVSNADAHVTFNRLLRDNTEERLMIKNFVESPSMFAVFLGLDVNLAATLKDTANIMYLSNYKFDTSLFDIKKIAQKEDLEYLVCAFSSSHDPMTQFKNSTLTLYIFASYENAEFWSIHKEEIADKMINVANKLIPNLNKHIKEKFYATPQTFERFTSNYKGAYVGWLPIQQKSRKIKFTQKTSINGLYCVGHWYTNDFLPSGGVPVVSFSGRRAAKLILEDLGQIWPYKEITL